MVSNSSANILPYSVAWEHVSIALKENHFGHQCNAGLMATIGFFCQEISQTLVSRTTEFFTAFFVQLPSLFLWHWFVVGGQLSADFGNASLTATSTTSVYHSFCPRLFHQSHSRTAAQALSLC